MQVVVVGAGLAGLTCAYALQEGGAHVVVLERAAAPGREASFANGALLHPSHVEPWNSPGVLGFMLSQLGRRDSPMRLRLHALPSLLGWGVDFIANSRADRYFANTLHNLRLAQHSVSLIGQWRRAMGLHYGEYQRGALQIQRSAAAMSKTTAWAHKLGEHGSRFQVLSRDELLGLEPALKPIAKQLAGGVHYLRDEGGDARRFCEGVSVALAKAGVVQRFATTVKSLAVTAGRVTGVQLASGETLQSDAVVLAAASHSVALAAPLGLKLPIQPVKGYSITMPSRGENAPSLPIIDPDAHTATVPLSDTQLRMAGTAEFGGFDLRIDPARVAYLRRLFARQFPKLAQTLSDADVTPWAGLRPMTSDGVPLIGATPVPGLYLNTGHGQLGWTLACGSGRLAADVVLSRQPQVPPEPYSINRFRGRRG